MSAPTPQDADLTFATSRSILERNSKLIPGGLASINRLADPCISFSRARGAYLFDVDGNRYIDYHAGFAPYILGHNDPDQNEAVVRTLTDELSNYGSGPTEQEGELAELFLQSVTSCDKVQFFNTGSEATAQAIRIARAWTGREHVVLIQGGYNGNHNIVAANLMTPMSQLGGTRVVGDEYPLVPITAGIPVAEQSLMHAIEFNDLAAVETVAQRYQIAALITEPVLQNVGVVKPESGYLEGLRKLADRYGFLLVFDEVKTGFRASLGGYQKLCGVTPDLSSFGKALANGFPIAALAGKAPYMDLAVATDPAKRVLIAGTYNCHPVPAAAAIACLKKLRDHDLDVYGRLEQLGAMLEDGLKQLFAGAGIPAVVVRLGSAFCVYFTKGAAPRCWWNILEQHDFEYDLQYRRALIQGGIYHFPVPCKQGSISFAHSEDDIHETLAVTRKILSTLS
jgi:glutamate-1-semialdehyde 2,1-aminomutase